MIAENLTKLQKRLLLVISQFLVLSLLVIALVPAQIEARKLSSPILAASDCVTGSFSNTNGKAFVFYRPMRQAQDRVLIGHVGWGFQMADNLYCFGATEGKPNTGLIVPGQDNGFWFAQGSFTQMIAAMRGRDYESYREINVSSIRVNAAVIKALETKAAGYAVIYNNCLDHTYWILGAYGVPFVVLPPPQSWLLPFAWYEFLLGWSGKITLSLQSGSIGGRVKSSNGTPVSGATVKFQGNNLRGPVTTDNSGYYSISEVLAGPGSVTATKSGMSSGAANITVIANATTQVPDIVLNTTGGGTNSLDNAQFIADVNYPDNPLGVVQPGQTLTKIWRLKNTGATTWNNTYQLCYRAGSQWSGQSCIGIPNTAPSQIADVGLPLQVPATATPGAYNSSWQLRNSYGTYFGDVVWWKLQIGNTTQPPGNGVNVELVSMEYPQQVSPGQTFRPKVRVRVTSGQLKIGDMLRFFGGTNYTGFEHVAVENVINTGGEYLFEFYQNNPFVAPTAGGTYESKWRVWANGGYVGPEFTIRFTVYEAAQNRPPNRPSNVSPGDLGVTIGTMPTLTAQHNGDPDGDSITHYKFDIIDSCENKTSGWQTSNSYTPPNSMPACGYQWKVQVRDARGAESEYGPTWRFNKESTTLSITNFYFEPSSPSNSAMVKIRGSVSGCGAHIHDFAAYVNTANDGSANGTWIRIGGLGVASFNDDDAPKWDTLEYDEGQHRIRLVAEGSHTMCPGAYTSQEKVYQLTRSRPSRPYQTSPANKFWSNSQTVTFRWTQAKRVNQNRLLVGTDVNLTTKLLDVTLPGSTTEYTYTFPQEYPAYLYWKVDASNEVGMTDPDRWQIGVDTTPPTSQVDTNLTPAVVYEPGFGVALAASDNASGLFNYDIQYRLQTESEWHNWLTSYTYASAIFNGQPGQTYCFRSRARDIAGNLEEYPTSPDQCVKVDPTSRPPQAWWNAAWGKKRNLTVQNLMNDRALVNGYPIFLHFDSTTNPTAAELYNASLTNPKGADVRIIHNDQVEERSAILKFEVNAVDIMFVSFSMNPLPAPNGSYTRFSIYYGNASATSTSRSLRDIYPPAFENGDVLVMPLDEGSGTTTADLSGFGHTGTLTNATWQDGKLGKSLYFNGNSSVRINDSSKLQISNQLTVQAWVKPTLIDNNTRNILAKFNPNYPASWRMYTVGSGELRFHIHSVNQEIRLEYHTPFQAGKWYHVAGVFDGSTVRLFVNGVQVDQANYSYPINSSPGSPLWVGTTGYQGEYWVGNIDQVVISSVARTNFNYGTVWANPTAVAGQELTQQSMGPSNLKVQSVQVVANSGPEGGSLVRTTLTNSGAYQTFNEFTTYVYKNHTPSGAGDLDGAIGFSLNTPIAAGQTITITKLITETGLAQLQAQTGKQDSASVGELVPSCFELTVQVDATGTTNDTDRSDNISSSQPVCVEPGDSYESDNSPAQARLLEIKKPQTHNLHSGEDEDWLKFDTIAQLPVILYTSELGTGSDTILNIYGSDGTTLLATNDDYANGAASLIHFTPQTSGVYYVRVSRWNFGATTATNTYAITLAVDLSVTKSVDNGQADTPGTLSYSLAHAQSYQEDIIGIALSGGNTIKLAGNQALPILPPGVILVGRCGLSGPEITIDGSELSSSGNGSVAGLSLSNSNLLYGLQIKGFPGVQIKASGKNNRLVCVSARKAKAAL